MKKFLFFIIIAIMPIVTSCNLNNLYEKTINKVVEICCEKEMVKSYGTGTLISKNGLILTNKHIFDYVGIDSTIKINFINDEQTYIANIFDISENYDLCLLKIEKNTSCFKNFSQHIRVAEEVYTIGNINGFGLSYQCGLISSEYKNMHYNETNILTIQTTIEIYNGSSGGPLFDSKGNLLGIMTFRIKDNGIFIPGMSFAIPTIILEEYLGELKI